MIPQLLPGAYQPKPGINWFNQVADAVNDFQKNRNARRPGDRRADRQPTTTSVLVKNVGDTIPAIGIARWNGPHIGDASLSSLPDIVLTTVADGGYVGVAVDRIQANEVGEVVSSGVAWVRCRGVIALGDSLEPDSDFYGVSSSSASNCVALAPLGYGDEGVIPVFVGSGSGASNCGTPRYSLILWYCYGGVLKLSLIGVFEPIEISWNSTAEEAEDVINAAIGGGATVTGGPLPLANLLIELPVHQRLIVIPTSADELTGTDWTPDPTFTLIACGGVI